MNILVLFGGRSAERDVSCVSATAVLKNLSPRFRPLLARIDPQGRWFYQKDPKAFARHPQPHRYPFDNIPAHLEPGAKPRLIYGSKTAPIDIVFPALHGPMGEDGTLQGMLEMMGVAYVGCGVLGSAVGMDKEASKRLAGLAGLPILPYVALEKGDPMAPARRLRLPVFVKPARLGSSVGVYKVKKQGELSLAVSRAFRFDTTVIVEQGIPAREIECSVLGGGRLIEASKVVGEIRPNAEFYSYEAKYLDPNGAQSLIPAKISAVQVRRIREMSIAAFRALTGGYGFARVDFLMNRFTGKIWFNEINTLPGLTPISQYPKLWEASGLHFPKLLDRLISLGLARHRERSHLRITRD